MLASRSLILVTLCAMLALSACGRKAPLDTPYQGALDARQEAEEAGDEPLPPVPTPPVQDRRFILDGLI